MQHSKKTHVQRFNDNKSIQKSLPKQELNNPKIIEKKPSSKKRYIAITILSGVCLCGLFAISIVVPLLYSLYGLQTETTTTTTPTSILTTGSVITNGTMVTTPSTTTAGSCGNGSTLLTFDDLTFSIAVPYGYKNINWTNAYTYYTPVNSSGYYTGTVSKNNTVYNGFGNLMIMKSINGSLLTLYSAAVAAAWRDNLQLTVLGYSSNVVIANNTYTLQVFTLSYLTFTGYSGLDTIIFTTHGGIKNIQVSSNGMHFAMDNICLSFI